MDALIMTQVTFEASHFLPGHEKCESMHGHTYTVDVGVRGEVNNTTGMVMDFAVLDRACKDVAAMFDHQTLNDVLALGQQPPTAENIAAVFMGLLGLRAVEADLVRVWEGKKHSASVWRRKETPECMSA